MPEPLEAIRREVVLYRVARRLGKKTDVLVKELEKAGVLVMGRGKGRTVYVDEIVAYQAERERAAREKPEQDDLARDYVKAAGDDWLTKERQRAREEARRGR